MNTFTYVPLTLGQRFNISLAETRIRLTTISRYPGQLVMEIVIPIVFAALPMLLGRATAGDQAAANFAANTGTANYVAYLLIGANTFSMVSLAFWHVAYWLRYEQETGTLEAIYLSPTSSTTLLVGVAIYSAVRGIGSSIIAYLLGCLIFGVNPIQGDVLLAMLFVFIGLIPVYALTLLFGAVVIRVKESNALISLMQWGVSFFMGIFFPIAVMPPFLRAIALAFPPTWMVNDVRAALLGVGYFFGTWYLDMAMIWVFILIVPLLSMFVFHRVETRMRRNEGLGQF